MINKSADPAGRDWNHGIFMAPEGINDPRGTHSRATLPTWERRTTTHSACLATADFLLFTSWHVDGLPLVLPVRQ